MIRKSEWNDLLISKVTPDLVFNQIIIKSLYELLSSYDMVKVKAEGLQTRRHIKH